MKKIKTITLGLLIALTTTACGGAGTQNAGPVELTIWEPFVSSEHIRPLIQEYQKAHPNVRIEFVESDRGSYSANLINALAAGNGPDIFAIHNSWLPQYIDKTTPAPEGSWQFVDYKRDFVGTVVDDFTRDNKIYGAALSVDSLALYYNPDMLASSGVYTPPKTWKELEQAVRKIAVQNSSGYFTRSGLALGLSSSAPGGKIHLGEDVLYLFMLQQGVVPWESDLSRPRFGDAVDRGGERVDAAANALQFYTSFADPEAANYSWNTRSDYSIDAFVNRRAAMIFDYSYTRETIQQKNATLRFDVAPVPQLNLADQEVNFANYWGEVVSRQSKNPEVAWDFLKFITSKENLEIYYATTKVPSSRKDLISLQASDPEIGVFAHANSTAKSFLRPEAEKMDSILSKMIDRVNFRGQDPDRYHEA